MVAVVVVVVVLVLVLIVVVLAYILKYKRRLTAKEKKLKDKEMEMSRLEANVAKACKEGSLFDHLKTYITALSKPDVFGKSLPHWVR